MSITRIYETVIVLHPELSEEDVETTTQSVVSLLTDRGSEIIRTERGGKRRLAYPIHKQRYGYYNLIHFRASPDVLTPLERSYRLNDRIIRYLTLHVEQEEHLTSLTRMGDDEGRDDERDERRRGGRRGEPFRSRAMVGRRAIEDEDEDEEPDSDHESTASSVSIGETNTTPATE
jgi:small subunit ribosomal protein S6